MNNMTKYDNVQNIKDALETNLHLDYSDNDINKELLYIKNSKGNINASCLHNKLILKFQQDNFYKTEKELFCNDASIREKLIDNRLKYLHKDLKDISNAELLRGFKISKIYQGYSHFSPDWMKYFIKKYKVKCIYDPCGGWGHHMLGAWSEEVRYIYNDLSTSTYNSYKDICKFLDMPAYLDECYSADARYFNPENILTDLKSIDYAWFMCPPYYNIEKYECKSFDNIEEYENFLSDIIDIWKKSHSSLFGIIIKSEYEYIIDTCLYDYEMIERTVVNTKCDHMTHNGKCNEYLYVYRK